MDWMQKESEISCEGKQQQQEKAEQKKKGIDIHSTCCPL